jgi:tetratricopeptide (TPR) repeat protein
MNTIPHYCQYCGANNQLGERSCRKCGTRLMLVVFPPSIRHDEGIVPSYYEDHLLERVTLLEIRLTQVAERLSLALDLMLRQSKNTHSDHLLLETLIDSLNTLGALEKDKLTQKWRKNVEQEELGETAEEKNKRAVKKIRLAFQGENAELFENLLRKGLNFLAQQEERQAFRAFERALQISPENIPLILFIAQLQFQADKFESAKDFLEKAYAIEPTNEQVLFFLGIISADLLDLKRAKVLLYKLTEHREMKYCVNYVLGLMAVFERDWKTAFESFRETLNAFEAPETHYLLGCVYFQLGKYKMALRHLQKAVENDTNFADAWFMLAVIYQMTGDETKSYQSVELTWSSKEAGADCLKFMKRGVEIEIETALPFFRLKDLKKNLIMSSSIRFSKLFREEVSKILNL